MKIIMSPSKTKKLTGWGEKPLFVSSYTQHIVDVLQTLPLHVLVNKMKIKEDKGKALLDLYRHMDDATRGEGVTSYTGLAFKSLDYQSLPIEAKAFAADHFVILSALYGVVEPGMNIVDYRLDLVDSLFGEENLYDLWRPVITDYFAKEDWILNLASKEYSAVVNHPRMITVEFLEEKNGVWRQMSTASKQMRGCLGRYMLCNQSTSIESLPIQIGSFVRQKEDLDSHTIRYFKQG